MNKQWTVQNGFAMNKEQAIQNGFAVDNHVRGFAMSNND